MKRPSRSGKMLAAISLGIVVLAGIGVLAAGVVQTEALIKHRAEQVLAAARSAQAPRLPSDRRQESLPAPVRRWIEFTFRAEASLPRRLVRYQMEGRFRRPGSDSFEPMEAAQYIAAGRPAFVFEATTWMFPGFWARAMDAYVSGDMDMKARILSTITAVDETGDPALNQESVQRYLLESVMVPSALLPSERLHCEPINRRSAWAVMSHGGTEARYRVKFDDRGAIQSMRAPRDGSLDQPYHGAGEYAVRGGYKQVAGVMVPTEFEIARVIDGQIRPFWKGRVTKLDFDVVQLF